MENLNKNQQYLVSIFDGIFSADMIANKRSTVFYRIANFVSPRTKIKASSALTEDEIGEIINELDSLQFNRALAPRVAKAGEASF